MKPDPQKVAAAHVAKAGITTQQVGRRVYFRGNTYPVKNDLRALGARWDRDEYAWWISTTKFRKYQDEINSIIEAGKIPRATRKQVDYLVRLHEGLGIPFNRRELERIPMAEVSKLIEGLKSKLKTQPKPSRSDAPSERQVNYALRLIKQLGRYGWLDTDYGQAGGPPPTRRVLEGWSRKDVSSLIDSLRGEFY